MLLEYSSHAGALKVYSLFFRSSHSVSSLFKVKFVVYRLSPNVALRKMVSQLSKLFMVLFDSFGAMGVSVSGIFCKSPRHATVDPSWLRFGRHVL